MDTGSENSSSSYNNSFTNPARSPEASDMSNLRAQQRHMQEQMDYLTAQMAAHQYHAHPPYYPQEMPGTPTIFSYLSVSTGRSHMESPERQTQDAYSPLRHKEHPS